MSAFLTIAVIHFLALISPGPDFVVIVKQSVSQPRRIVAWTALGISLAMLLHVGYTLLGLGFIIAQSIVVFTIIKLLGAAYLLYIGWKSLTAKTPASVVREMASTQVLTPWAAVKIGFLCNALNPKFTLFLLALFTQVIAPETPLAVQIFYGLWMSFIAFLWFSSVGSLLTMPLIRRSMGTIHIYAERVMGAVLIALGLKVAFSSRN